MHSCTSRRRSGYECWFGSRLNVHIGPQEKSFLMGLLAHLIIVPAWVIPPGQLDPLKNGKVVGSLKKREHWNDLGKWSWGTVFWGASCFRSDETNPTPLAVSIVKNNRSRSKLPIASFFLCLWLPFTSPDLQRVYIYIRHIHGKYNINMYLTLYL